MAFWGEIVEDWKDLTEQIQARLEQSGSDTTYVIAAILLLARELRDYRRSAEEHYST